MAQGLNLPGQGGFWPEAVSRVHCGFPTIRAAHGSSGSQELKDEHNSETAARNLRDMIFLLRTLISREMTLLLILSDSILTTTVDIS